MFRSSFWDDPKMIGESALTTRLNGNTTNQQVKEKEKDEYSVRKEVLIKMKNEYNSPPFSTLSEFDSMRQHIDKQLGLTDECTCILCRKITLADLTPTFKEDDLTFNDEEDDLPELIPVLP